MQKNTGYLVVNVKSAKLTRDTDLIGKIDPYVLLQLSHYKEKTVVIKDGGLNVQWNQQIQFQVADFEQQLKVTVFDDDGGNDDIIGYGNVDIMPYVKQPWKEHQMDVFLTYKEKQTGNVKISLMFKPSNLGTMFVNVKNAQFTKDLDTFGKQDPYLKLQYGAQTKKTTAKQGGGKACQWNQVYTFQILAFDDDGGNDDLIGKKQLQFEAMAHNERDYNVKIEDDKGQQTGVVTISLRFEK